MSASALGIIDVHAPSVSAAAEGIARVSRLTDSSFGVRVSAEAVLAGCEFGDDLAGLMAVCIPVGCRDAAMLDDVVELIRDSGRFAVGEVTCREEVGLATKAAFPAIIVAGHEAGGWGGAESSFVLLQGVLAEGGPPVWVRGGVGPNVAAGCVAAGAAGVVLDGALLLARESPLDPEWRERIARWDGSETTAIGPASRPGVRVFALPGSGGLGAAQKGRRRGRPVLGSGRPRRGRLGGWPVPAGRSGRGVGGSAGPQVRDGRRDRPGRRAGDRRGNRGRAGRPAAGGIVRRWPSPTARAIPILQGPMTRVSDVPGFAEAVARGGGLPFLALALLREAEVRTLLRDAAAAARGTALGRGHPGLRAAGAARRATGRRAGVPPAVRPDRRRPARPGRRAGTRGDRHLPARPLAGLARPVPARRVAPVRARGPRVRRARRPAVELRPLGAGRRRGGRGHRPRHSRRAR